MFNYLIFCFVVVTLSLCESNLFFEFSTLKGVKRPKRGVSRPTPHTFFEFIYDFRLLENHYDVGLQDVSYLLGGGGHCGYLDAQQRGCDRDLALGVDH